MLNMRKSVLAAVPMIALLASSAAAQGTAGIGTTKAGATFQTATGVATVASKAGVNIRTQPLSGTQQYLPIINAGRMEFGTVNVPQLAWAMNGTGLSEGHKMPNLRIVATLMQFNTGTVVAADSPFKTTADMKGQRLPLGYSGAALFQKFSEAMLANGGLTVADVTAVPVTSLQQGWDLLAERKVVSSTGAVGTGYLDLVAQKLGGIRFLQFDDSPEAFKRTNAVMPGIEIVTVTPPPGKKLTGLDGPTKMVGYYMMLITHKDVPEDLVYKVAKAVYEGQKDLQSQSPLWRTYKAENMGIVRTAPVHPGAIKLLKEKGVWKP